MKGTIRSYKTLKGRGIEPPYYEFPEWSIYANTKAQARNVVIYASCKYLLRASRKAIANGDYLHATVNRVTRTDDYYMGTFRAYRNKDIRDGKEYIEILAGMFDPKQITLSLEQAKNTVKRLEKLYPDLRYW